MVTYVSYSFVVTSTRRGNRRRRSCLATDHRPNTHSGIVSLSLVSEIKLLHPHSGNESFKGFPVVGLAEPRATNVGRGNTGDPV